MHLLCSPGLRSLLKPKICRLWCEYWSTCGIITVSIMLLTSKPPIMIRAWMLNLVMLRLISSMNSWGRDLQNRRKPHDNRLYLSNLKLRRCKTCNTHSHYCTCHLSPLCAQEGAPLSSPSCHSRPANGLNLWSHRASALSYVMAVHSYGKQLFKCLNSKQSLVFLIYLFIYFLHAIRLPLHGPSHRSHHAQPSSGGPGGVQSSQLNELQHSFQNTELPHSVWRCWYYSGKEIFTEIFDFSVRLNDNDWEKMYLVERQFQTFASGGRTWASIL